MKPLFNIILSIILLTSPLSLRAEIEAQTISTRIVGGQESVPEAWPAMVSIKDKLHNYHFCGGSLIAQQWVVTAAHCMHDSDGNELKAKDITATVGEYDLGSWPTTPPTDIELVLVHKDYDPSTQVDDIALLKLAVPVTNESIPIASLASTNNWIAQQAPATVSGWGSTVAYKPNETVTADYPDLLNEVEVQLKTDQQCTNSLGTSYSSEMICAGVSGGGKDACQGDSGGPLMVNSNNGWQQIGIVSWGVGCASTDYPGVYTRLALYDDWIHHLQNLFTTFSVPVNIEFSQVAVNSSETQEIIVENYSDSEAHFIYQFDDSEFFSFDAGACETVAAHDNCLFDVTYTPLDTNAQGHTATITVTSDIPDAEIQTTDLYVKTISSGGSSGGALGVFTLLLLPLLFIRRCYS